MLTETVLWTNPSPTASRTGTNIITLSQSYENFEYVRIDVDYLGELGNIKGYIMTPSDLYNKLLYPCLSLGRFNASGQYSNVRHIYSDSYSSITDVFDGTNSGWGVNCIITQVVGLK